MKAPPDNSSVKIPPQGLASTTGACLLNATWLIQGWSPWVYHAHLLVQWIGCPWPPKEAVATPGTHEDENSWVSDEKQAAGILTKFKLRSAFRFTGGSRSPACNRTRKQVNS